MSPGMKLLTTEHMAMFVVKSIVIQNNGQVNGSINYNYGYTIGSEQCLVATVPTAVGVRPMVSPFC